MTLWLSEDDKLVQRMELRGHSHITATGQSTNESMSAAQSMSADNIDVFYAEDGRTLKTARLMENSVLQLPGVSGAAGRRIAGRTIDIAMGPTARRSPG